MLQIYHWPPSPIFWGQEIGENRILQLSRRVLQGVLLVKLAAGEGLVFLLGQISLAGKNEDCPGVSETDDGYHPVIFCNGWTRSRENLFNLALTGETWSGLVSKGFRPLLGVGEDAST